ncbi:MAG: cyclic nucleotide-binding domain-containing protein [Kofleriaceae bacterium]
MSTRAVLERHPLLAHLPPERLARLAREGEVETWKGGEDIVVEGSLGDALFLILSGDVAVHRGGQTFATLGGGEIFGEMSMVEPAPRSANVTAMSPTFLFRLPHDSLHRLLIDDPQTASALLVQIVKTLSERLRRANQRLSSVDQLADWLAGSLV